MADNNIFKNWYEAYLLIAKALYRFYQENEENPASALYIKLKETKFFDLNNGRLFRDRLSRISEWGLDPIQIFATFNYPKIGERRIVIINSLLEQFRSEKRVNSDTSFEGCPSPIITQIMQYRGWAKQNEIWRMFDTVMKKGIHGLNHAHFSSMKEWRGIDIASLTMFLYWINSEEFLPMDRNTVEFLKSFKVINSRPRTYNEYFNLCTKNIRVMNKEYNSAEAFKNIVKDAYLFFNTAYSGTILSGTTTTFISNATKYTYDEDLEVIAQRKQKDRIKGFQIVALRPRKKSESKEAQKHLKNLSVDILYQFYQAYQFENENDNRIKYHPKNDIDLYSIGDLNISISAIVGKNGSGKSTLAEFLYLIFNRIAFLKNIKSTEKLVDEEVYADLFIRLDKLYKISVGQNIEIFEYELKDDNFYHIVTESSSGRSTFKKFDVESFCYSIVMNYSLYALNTNTEGDWIYPLFHKNDSYQVPLVLNPLRKAGIIDVNVEESLAKSRLLSNILEPESIDFENNIIPELVPNSIPIKLELTFDEEKIKRKKESFRNRYKNLYNKHIEKVINSLEIDLNLDEQFISQIKEYIYFKIVTISDRYPKFREFEELPKWVSKNPEKLKKYILKLSEETSHITFKLKQAINYLKYGIYKSNNSSIILISKNIQDIKEDNGIRTIDLVPPAFFKTNVIFNHGGSFNNLSSGEKQQILSINTIVYHIYNIASVMYEEDSFKYNNINIIFDEVELYFHPEMQRTYIRNLLIRISNFEFDNSIHNINILFITHSPFILSDIPSSNILRLNLATNTKRSIPINNVDQTFGANIHDLLANDFFLENGFMGEFAKFRINQVIQFLNLTDSVKKLEKINEQIYTSKVVEKELVRQKERLKEAILFVGIKLQIHDGTELEEDINKCISWLKNCNSSYYKSIIDNIGEPVIKNKLLANYNEFYDSVNDREFKFLQLAKQLNYDVTKKG